MCWNGEASTVVAAIVVTAFAATFLVPAAGGRARDGIVASLAELAAGRGGAFRHAHTLTAALALISGTAEVVAHFQGRATTGTGKSHGKRLKSGYRNRVLSKLARVQLQGRHGVEKVRQPKLETGQHTSAIKHVVAGQDTSGSR